MARNKANQPNIDNSNPAAFPNGRIKNNTGAGDGTAVNESVYGDIHEVFAKLMRLYGIPYNNQPDNETNGYQYVDALRALASKNDFILDINSVGGKLVVPIKLTSMLPNEQVICKSAVIKGAETEITGSDGVSRAVTFIGDFKAGEYIRLINTSSTVVLIRMVDAVNLDSAITELEFLKAASTAEEITGALSNKATTPESNLLAFVERVNGTASNGALAMAGIRNGLLSAADKTRIDNLSDPAELIKVTSATDIQVNGYANGAYQNNFNFNYVDVFPPTGKTMANLRGFMASYSENWQYGKANDDTWCKWQVQSGKIRVICGNGSAEKAPSLNWLAIWI
tara:strand:+ start:6235 stop:7251 length:1017 start_codon:yes stop_codon:yes gene_type:complete